MTKVSMFGAVDVREMPLLQGLEYCEFVGHVGVRAEERGKVDVRD